MKCDLLISFETIDQFGGLINNLIAILFMKCIGVELQQNHDFFGFILFIRSNKYVC